MGSFPARIFLVLSLLGLGACAFSDSVPVIDGTERGFTYPVCYPFLVVSGGKADLLMVPNPNKLRAAQFGAFLAKNDLDVTFEQCGPSHLKSNMDSTTVAVALFNTLTEVGKAGHLFGAKEGGDISGQSFQVFEFIFDKSGTFVGLKPHIQKDDFVTVRSTAVEKKDITQQQSKNGRDGKLDGPLKKSGAGG